MKILTVLATLLLALPAAADIPRLITAAEPAEGTVPLALEELWRVGGEDGDLIFGRIVGVTGGPEGRIYVMDNQLCEVTVLGPDGEFVGTVGREGDGPGEVRQPTGVVVTADGTVGIGSGFPGRVIRIAADGSPLDTCHLVGEPSEGNIGVMISLHLADGVIGATGARLVMDPTGAAENYADRFLALADADCAEPVRILHRKTPLDPTGRRWVEADDYYIDALWDLGPDGTVYTAWERDAYAVSVFARTGELLRVFGREEAPRRRTAEEKDAVSPVIGLVGRYDERVIGDTDPAVARVMYDHAHDRVWVLSSRGAEPDDPTLLEVWDIFSAEGAYLRRAPVPLGDAMNEGTLYLVGGDRLVVVRGSGSRFVADAEADEDTPDEETEPLEVICYRMK